MYNVSQTGYNNFATSELIVNGPPLFNHDSEQSAVLGKSAVVRCSLSSFPGIQKVVRNNFFHFFRELSLQLFIFPFILTFEELLKKVFLKYCIFVKKISQESDQFLFKYFKHLFRLGLGLTMIWLMNWMEVNQCHRITRLYSNPGRLLLNLKFCKSEKAISILTNVTSRTVMVKKPQLSF